MNQINKLTHTKRTTTHNNNKEEQEENISIPTITNYFNSSSSSLSINNLSFFFLFFTLCGIPLTLNNSIYFHLYHFIIIIILLIIFIYLIISTINHLNSELYTTITIIIYYLNGLISYLTISYIVYYKKYNIILLFKSLSIDNNNYINRFNTNHYNSNINNIKLKSYINKWLFISFFIGSLSYILFYIAYGKHADVYFFDLSNNSGWRIINIAYIYINAGWLLPMVLIRVGSYYLERRIYLFIEYLENSSHIIPKSFCKSSIHNQFHLRKFIQEHIKLFFQSEDDENENENNNEIKNIELHDDYDENLEIKMNDDQNTHEKKNDDQFLNHDNENISNISIDNVLKTEIISLDNNNNTNNNNNIHNNEIPIHHIMAWYDDLHQLNQQLSHTFSPIIFQSILFIFPVILSILQSFLYQELTTQLIIARVYWLMINTFILFMITTSVANLDSLNVYIMRLIASISSSVMFQDDFNICQYRLIISKLNTIPLGVNIYGLNERITYQLLWTITSLVVSIFLFLLGYSI